MVTLKYTTVETVLDAYNFFNNEINKGHIITTRNENTLEALNVVVTIKDPTTRIVNNVQTFDIAAIFLETFDILNGNKPRAKFSKSMLKKTMGDENNSFFFGNEMREACSLSSLKRTYSILLNDKNSRKAILDLNTRQPKEHIPCLVFAHFFIRNNQLHTTLETRSTSVEYGLLNDIFVFSTIQEILYGWLKETYQDLDIGTFTYKTIHAHKYIDIESSHNITTQNNQTIHINGSPLSYSQFEKEWNKLTNLEKNNRLVKSTSELNKIVTTIEHPYYKHWANKLIQERFN